MLDKDAAARIDKCKNGHKLFVFLCETCRKEIRVNSARLKTSSGKCLKCSRRNRHRYQTLYNTMKTSVRRTNERFGRELPFSLSFEDFLVFTEVNSCRYCGGSITWAEWKPGPYNLDRKDNNKGYHVDNLVVCCFACNHKKNKFYSGQEFSAITDYLRLWRSLDPQEQKELEYMVTSWNDKWEIV